MDIGDRSGHRTPTGRPRSGGRSRRAARAPKARIWGRLGMTRAFERGSGQPPAGQPFGHLPFARVPSYSMGPSPYHNAGIGIKRQMSRAGCGA